MTATTDYGFTFGYQHQWNEKWTSLVLLNQGGVEDTNGQALSDLSQASHAAANLLYHFTKNAFVEAEYLYGLRKDFSGDAGTANKLQFSVSYTINLRDENSSRFHRTVETRSYMSDSIAGPLIAGFK